MSSDDLSRINVVQDYFRLGDHGNPKAIELFAEHACPDPGRIATSSSPSFSTLGRSGN